MTITLRNGETVEDQRLDRLPQPDERNADYPITAVVPGTLKTKSWRLLQRLDQGQEGQCVSYAWHHEACATPAPRKAPSPEILRERYHRMQEIDPWPGGEYAGASPNYSGTSVLAGAQVMQAAGYFSEYRWAFTVHDVLLALTHEGPVVLGVDWYEGMFTPDARGLIRISGNKAGGHAILARGCNLKTREIILRNSWGPNYGVKGDCRIGFDDLERLLADGGDACVPVNRF